LPAPIGAPVVPHNSQDWTEVELNGARAEMETRRGRWNVEADTVLQVAGLLNSTLERERVPGVLAEQFLRICSADWVVVTEVTGRAKADMLVVGTAHKEEKPFPLPLGTAVPLDDDGIVQRTLWAHDPTWLQHGRDPVLVDLPGGLSAAAVLLVPLVFAEAPLGVMVAGWNSNTQSPSNPDMRLVQGLANVAATAMENARLFADAERRAAQVTALFEIGRDISAHLGLGEILQSIVQKAQELVKSDASFLALLTPDGLELEMTASVGLRTEAMRSLRLRREQGLAGAVVASGEPIIVDDLPRLVTLKDAPLRIVQEEGLASQIAVPLSDGKSLLGVLYIANRQPEKYDPDDAQLLMAFAKQATIAIQNARLYAEAVAHRERAEAGRRRLQVIIDSMPEGVLIAEGQEGRISAVNRAGEDLLGVDRLTGLAFEELASALGLRSPQGSTYSAGDFPLIQTIRRGEVCLGVEVVLRGADGRNMAVLINGAPFRDPEGRISGAVAVFQDISKAKEAEQLKDEFISLVSHELRTPLTSIKGAASTLLRHYSTLDEDTRQELLLDIDEEADRLYRLVENLLDFSRSEAGMLRLATEPVHVGRLAAKVVKHISVRAPRHRFSISFAADLPPAEADPIRVEQVLRNLLDNAVKYSPAGGQIEVRGELSGGRLLVAVRDEGVGILPADQGRVFQRFQQAAAASDVKSAGVGLGLAICQRLVEAHDGAIWAESEQGSGSTFFFTLPLVQEEWG
jgi:two-component system, OmpR family, phosphate regulon sensor histidine kinase PhoR